MLIEISDIRWIGNNAYIGSFNIARIVENVGHGGSSYTCTELCFYFPAGCNFQPFDKNTGRKIIKDLCSSRWTEFINLLSPLSTHKEGNNS